MTPKVGLSTKKPPRTRASVSGLTDEIKAAIAPYIANVAFARTPEREARFWSLVRRDDPDVCWVWLGSMTNRGYGAFRCDRHRALAHRYAWSLANGTIPEGQVILHLCDNPRCVNPHHLRAGTQAENMRDMTSKGRQRRGNRAPFARLTEDAVRVIRTSNETNAALASRFGVTAVTVANARRRRSWKSVT